MNFKVHSNTLKLSQKHPGTAGGIMFWDCANFPDCPPHIVQVDINTGGGCVDTTAAPGTIMTRVCSWSLTLLLLLVTVQVTFSAPAGTHAEVTLQVKSTITVRSVISLSQHLLALSDFKNLFAILKAFKPDNLFK